MEIVGHIILEELPQEQTVLQSKMNLNSNLIFIILVSFIFLPNISAVSFGEGVYGEGTYEDSEDSEEDIIQESSSTGGTSYYISERNKLNDNHPLKLEIKMRENSKEEIKIYNQKNTGIDKLILISNKSITGEIVIGPIENISDKCSIPNNSIVYRSLEFNGTFEPEEISKAEVWIKINNSWIRDNNISEVKGSRCLPYKENLENSLVSEEEDFKTYSFKGNSFSTWVIFGAKEIPPLEEKSLESEENNSNFSEEDINPPEKKDNSLNKYLILSLVLIFILNIILIILYPKRKNKKH